MKEGRRDFLRGMLMFGGATVLSGCADIFAPKDNSTPTPVVCPDKCITPTPEVVCSTVTPAVENTPTIVVAKETKIPTAKVVEKTPTKVVAKATEKPAAISTATPRPTVAPTSTPVYDIELKPGECTDAPANSVVQGDVRINGVAYYDNGEKKTGLIIDQRQSASICAEWGADVTLGTDPKINTPEKRDAVIAQFVQEAKDHGCDKGQGCDTVDVIQFPGGVPQGQ